MATAGGATTQPLHNLAQRARTASRSLRSRVALLAAIFLAVPLLLYLQFQYVDHQRASLLRDVMLREGQIIAEGLRPLIGPLDAERAAQLQGALERMSASRMRARLFFRTNAETGVAPQLELVAAAPPLTPAQVETEQREIAQSATVAGLATTCDRSRALLTPFTNHAGDEELLTSLTPLSTATGCWMVVTLASPSQVGGSLFAAPYWQAPDIRYALLIYLAMAGLVFAIFTGIWNDLRGFAKLARFVRTYRGEAAFAQRNHVPELAPVAEEFDLLVRELRSSAEAVRRGAEDNVHAFKGPIGVIAQSLEPLRPVAQHDEKSRKALDRIEKSAIRLDALVTAVRRMDIATAESIGGKRELISLCRFITEFVDNYRIQLGPGAPRLVIHCDGKSVVRADPQHFETALENILDNAVVHTPGDKTVSIACSAEHDDAVIDIADQGPGVPEDHLGRMFERYYAVRPPPPEGGSANFGVGLWIARRNIESMGGTISAANEKGGGLRVSIRLPLT